MFVLCVTKRLVNCIVLKAAEGLALVAKLLAFK